MSKPYKDLRTLEMTNAEAMTKILDLLALDDVHSVEIRLVRGEAGSKKKFKLRKWFTDPGKFADL